MALTTPQRDVVLHHLHRLTSTRQHPKTICPSEVARAFSAQELGVLNASEWRQTMDDVRSVVWQLREDGELEVLQRGEVIDVERLEDVRGPMRVRAVLR
ncbi:hypothetical protein P153DRAFT_299573 [Dothidotthia symphoricarpi CBS 119687]|uniref:DUF3253 domain-containing protein n=1 Tax=Dothidotthia symphoricarpi CBS 119687 TaxID=1392245 RepID=A0A6A6A488_9PLEO|nr:uncharacterized protein P153DRAFT_299573 [Dothidotthia symphoricarpi CBS 119687]KAF2125934.1 hypothetical protein P153DRAFT_299573 [Dothidotthia symphoricarpi CBS 119687]